MLGLCSFVAYAYDITQDGIYYNIKYGTTELSVTYRGSTADQYDEYSGSVTIPSHVTVGSTTYTVTAIGEGAFYGCTGLSIIDLPSTITRINSNAFSGCTGLNTLLIPNSVERIDSKAFFGCRSLSTLTITESVNFIGEQAFSGCSGIYNIEVVPGNSKFDSRSECRAIIETATNSLVVGCQNTVIPNSVNSIGNYAFCNIGSLTSISIPESVISIGTNVFSGCLSLTELNFNAISCADFRISSSGSSSILPFSSTSLTTINIGDEVQRIPAHFVEGLTTLRKVSISNSVTSIGEAAFSGCNCMTNLVLGNSINSIEARAFYNCQGITEVSLPISLRTLGNGAFMGCNALLSLYCHSITPPVMVSNLCFSTYSSTILYVPYQSLNDYKTTYYWNSFKKIYGIDEESNILAEGISLNVTSKNLNVNQTFKLTATITPDLVTNKNVNWYSTNTNIVTVDSDGLITAVSDGNAKITATTVDGSNLSTSCDVVVTSIPATSISLNKSSLNLDVNETYQLVASVYPSNTTNKAVTWSTSNSAVAIVSNQGLVTPVAPGTTTINATTTDGTNLSASCQITIIKRVKSISLNVSDLTLIIPEKAQIVASVNPNDATNPILNWSSSKSSVATVDENGVVTPIAVGTTIIKVATTDGSNLSASCSVTVIKQYISSIILNEYDLVLSIGESAQLTAEIEPLNASNKLLTWSTGEPSIATVDNNGLVTAISGGTTIITAKSTDGSNISTSCTITVLPDYYLTLDTLSHIRGEADKVVELSLSLSNKRTISGFQFDIHFPDYVSLNEIGNDVFDIWLDDARKTRTHSVNASLISDEFGQSYRVLISSSSSKDLKGNDGELVHMNVLMRNHPYSGNYPIYVYNIVASESDETRHDLDNTQGIVKCYYVVGDADGNTIVDIADYNATASKILSRTPAPFYFDAANVDNNNSLDVVDLVGITNIALEIKPVTIRQAPRTESNQNQLYCEKLSFNDTGNGEINLGIDFGFDIAGLQMDMTLPNGLTFMGVSLGEDASQLSVVTENLPNGKIRILGISFSDAIINGYNPKLLTLKFKETNGYNHDSNVDFSNILFAERNLSSHIFDASSIEFVESSSLFEMNEMTKIYVQNGHIVVETPISGRVQLVGADGHYTSYEASIGRNEYMVPSNGIYIVKFNEKAVKVRL